jgi:hypothetical protein
MDIMGYTKLMDKNGIIAFLDFEKAFDTINWDVIYDTLTLFNLGPNLIKWVQTIYNEPVACVTNNGFSSPFFTLQRGVRQGCPLSAYLFIMVVELLAHKIRTSDEIKGIKIGDTEIKLVQMADDTTTFIEDEKSLENILKLLDTFEKYAGLKLNKSKTEAMWIGKNINNQAEPLQIKWVKEVHALGIFFSYNTDSVIQKNFMDRAKEFKKILDMWSQRNLSLIGKITILKSLAFSKVLYQCGVMEVPENFIEHLNDLAYSFVWSNKPNKIKRATLIADYEHGGLRMLDITSFLKAQKAMWVKRLLSPDEASWKALPNIFLEALLDKDTFKCNMKCMVRPVNFPEFYWDVLKYWFAFKDLTLRNKTAFDIRRESLWLNKNITFNNIELRGKTWEENGIKIIHDILNENGTFLSPADIENKYQIQCDIMKYNTLKEVIPSEWRKTLKTMKIPASAISSQETITLKINKQIKLLENLTNKDIYWVFINDKQKKPKITESRWNKLDITQEEWKEIFTLPSIIRDTKIKSFQYKLLFNLLPCNLYLQRIKRSDTDLCGTCHQLDDTAHYLVECEPVRIFWNSFNAWWNGWNDEHITLNKQYILAGILGSKTKNRLLNACIILAKWHIYKTKLNLSTVSFYKFLCELKYYLVVEKTIALRNENITRYTDTWQIIEDQLT